MNDDNMVVQMTIGDLKKIMTQVIEEVMNEKISKKPKKEKKEDKLLTREQAAKFLKVKKETLWHWNKKGELKAIKIGRRVYYNKEDIMTKLSVI